LSVVATGHIIPLDPVTSAPPRTERLLRDRPLHPGLSPDPALPADTRLWAALQNVSGGTWAGCVYDPKKILTVLEAGHRTLGRT